MNAKKLLLTLLSCAVFNHSMAQDNTDQSTTTETQVVEQLPKVDPAQAQKDLQSAYKKEYAFLTAQIKSIKTRTQEFKNSAAISKAQINREISAIENKLLDLDNVNNQLEDDLFQVERTTESATDNSNILEATIVQATSTLSEYGFDGFGDNSELSEIEKVAVLIEKAKQSLAENSIVRKTQGAFFLADGQEVNGTIIKVGNIASYGNSPQGSGPLAPAGEKKFKVWRDSNKQAVVDMFNGQSSASLPIFLYESSVKSIEEKQKKTVLSVIESGGAIAWIITILGIFALILVVLRFWFLKRASASTEKILNKIVTNIESNDMEGAIQVANSKKSSSSRVLYAVLRNIKRDREHIEDIVSESILHESTQLNRFGSLIMVVATVSPLLGLLGTVTGMITTFDIITEFGTGDPKALSSGISVALVTTEVGLAVAIPTLLFGNILSGWAEKIKDEMEKAALRVINVYKNTFA